MTSTTAGFPFDTPDKEKVHAFFSELIKNYSEQSETCGTCKYHELEIQDYDEYKEYVHVCWALPGESQVRDIYLDKDIYPQACKDFQFKKEIIMPEEAK